MTAGLTQRQARAALELGWPEAPLRALSARLRECDLHVIEVAGFGLQLEDRHGYRLVTYREYLDAEGGQDLGPVLVAAFEADAAAWVAWTDGSGCHEDDHTGAGVLLERPSDTPVEVSRHLGAGTNNSAELHAIRLALEQVRLLDRQLVIRSDSRWAIGALTRNWERRAHADLIERIRQDLAWRRGAVRFEHVHGHSGIPGNERADRLAKAGRAQGMPPKPAKPAKEPRQQKPRKERPLTGRRAYLEAQRAHRERGGR